MISLPIVSPVAPGPSSAKTAPATGFAAFLALLEPPQKSAAGARVRPGNGPGKPGKATPAAAPGQPLPAALPAPTVPPPPPLPPATAADPPAPRGAGERPAGPAPAARTEAKAVSKAPPSPAPPPSAQPIIAEAQQQPGGPPPDPAAPTAPALAPLAAADPAPAPDPPSPAAPPPAGAPPAPAHQIGDAVAVHLAPASGEVTVQLQPAELGTVQIRIERPPHGPPAVAVLVERPETLHALQQDLPRLHQALERAGVAPEAPVALALAPAAAAPANPGGAGLAADGGGQQRQQPAPSRQNRPAAAHDTTEDGTGAERAALGLNITA